MESLIATFHIDWKIMVAQAVNFAIVIAVLYFFALKPLKKLMDERSSTIQGGLDNAEKQKELLAAQKSEYEAAIADARAQVAVMIKQGKKDADLVRDELVQKAHNEVSAMIALGQKQSEANAAKMMDEVRNEAVSLVSAIAEKVLGSAVTEKVDAKLVEESMKQM